jgi:hypothetical protein
MLFLLQQPIVVDVSQPPAETARITYTEVILSAFGVAGGIMVIAALVGITVGWIIVRRKKRDEAKPSSGDTGHVRLRI